MADTKTCPECLADIPKKAKRCQHCSAKQKKNAGVLGWILAGLLVFIVVKCSLGTLSTQQSTQPSISVKPSTANINASSYGDKWPLTFQSGQVKCLPNGSVIFISSAGMEYGVNGTAKGHGYPSIDIIWNKKVGADGLRISIGPILDAGLKLCK